MRFTRHSKYIAMAVLLASSMPSLAQRATDALGPIVRCVAAGKFSVLDQGRLPATATSRSVEPAPGDKPVSLADGYRVILATVHGLPFVNLKVELSAASSAASDREAVEAQMKFLAARRMPDQKELQRTSEGGVDVLALHQPDLNRGGPISFYSLLQPASSIIATLYVLNQAAPKRAFSTYAEYEVLRDEAANLVQSCLKAAGA